MGITKSLCSIPVHRGNFRGGEGARAAPWPLWHSGVSVCTVTCDIPVMPRWAHAGAVKARDSIRLSSWGRCENDCYRHVHVHWYGWFSPLSKIIANHRIREYPELKGGHCSLTLPCTVKPADLQPGPFLIELGSPSPWRCVIISSLYLGMVR